ncbi:hypothetical protein HBI81_139760 [Parastagonospora nodorum]|nr:hypothetical protein HBI06_220410 [Parastagonospora nodorum]KAH4242661.1 hypothetical protein HBI05_087800 [Parastagonospora nodorum]KAH4900472.1 hypothetical protein HBI80_153290 [Parastagonospora nodorum]KAH4931094.1 hypothetical protein HBI79_108290 [Parastagonospora nodorum]KAH4933327.1 hypothetical protein HBH74_090720 [Parastagonospora nodorum]
MDFQSLDDSCFQDLASYQPAVDEPNSFFEDVAFREVTPYEQPAANETNHFFDETWHHTGRNENRLLGNYPANITDNAEYLFPFPDAFETPLSVDHHSAFLPWHSSDSQESDLFTSYLSGPDFMQHWPHPITYDSAVEIGSVSNGSGYPIGGYVFLTDDAKEGIATSLGTPFDPIQELEPLLSEKLEPQLALPTLAPKSRRTRISKAAKKVLEEHFGANPYPNEFETSSLVRATHLTGRTIKDWFSNTRSRKKSTTHIQTLDLLNEFNGIVQKSSRCASPAQSVCRASLEALEKHSPTASMSSLQRYIEAPVAEEAIPKEAVDAICKQVVDTTSTPPVSGTKFRTVLGRPRRAASSHKSNSVAGSIGSRGSARSDSTHISVKSQDSRGSRRGRKLWKRAQQDAESHPVQGSKVPFTACTSQAVPTDGPKYPTFENTGLPLLPYFCTWTDCSARFRFRWEWARHETALHYQPYHWICCLAESRLKLISQCFVCGLHPTTVGHIMDTHFTECTVKDRSEVTFLREDQLLQHIKGVHSQQKASKKICKGLMCIFKTENQDLHSSALDCGFCGRASKSWAEREDHVFEHLKEGMCKSAWWVGRFALPSIRSAHGEEPTLSEMDRSTKPSLRITWSCRYLYDHHAVFMTTSFHSVSLVSECKLCAYCVTGTEDEVKYRANTRQHAESHGLRLCSQAQFSTVSGFMGHLVAHHGAIRTFLSAQRLDSWTCQQEMTWWGEHCIASTAHMPPRSRMCNGKQDLLDGLPCL